jgi:hypothetical protein
VSRAAGQSGRERVRRRAASAPGGAEDDASGTTRDGEQQPAASSTAHLRAVEEQILLLQRPGMQTVKRQADLRGQEEADAFFLRILGLGAPYYWAWPICEMIEVSARTVPEWRLQTKDLVTPYGFSWFAHPIALYDPYREKTPQDGGGNHWLVGFCWGSLGADGIWVYSLYQAKPAVMQTGRQFGGYAKLGRGFRWRFGETIRDVLVHEPDPRYRGRIFRELDALSAAFLFLNQRIVRVDTCGDGPHVDAQERSSRTDADPSPLVRTVELRRLTTRLDRDTAPRQVEWSHRWLVSAHWRRQYYPSTDEHRPILISAYVKGPPEKPLKPPRAKVFAVVR